MERGHHSPERSGLMGKTLRKVIPDLYAAGHVSAATWGLPGSSRRPPRGTHAVCWVVGLWDLASPFVTQGLGSHRGLHRTSSDPEH